MNHTYMRSLQMPSRRHQMGFRGKEVLKKSLQALGYVIGVLVTFIVGRALLTLIFSF